MQTKIETFTAIPKHAAYLSQKSLEYKLYPKEEFEEQENRTLKRPGRMKPRLQ